MLSTQLLEQNVDIRVIQTLRCVPDLPDGAKTDRTQCFS